MPADICLPPELCPACEQSRAGRAAHVLEIENMPDAAVQELLALALRVEAAERSTHVQERIVGVGALGASFTVATTGLHLARRLLAALRRAWRTRLSTAREQDGRTVLTWSERRPRR